MVNKQPRRSFQVGDKRVLLINDDENYRSFLPNEEYPDLLQYKIENIKNNCQIEKGIFFIL